MMIFNLRTIYFSKRKRKRKIIRLKKKIRKGKGRLKENGILEGKCFAWNAMIYDDDRAIIATAEEAQHAVK